MQKSESYILGIKQKVYKLTREVGERDRVEK